MHSLEDLSTALLKAAKDAGADAADTLAIEGTSLAIDVRGGALEQAERSEGIDLGLRVFVGHRQACVSASNTSERTIAEMAERAIAMAKEAPEDPHAGLAKPDQLAQAFDISVLELTDPRDEPTAADLQDAANRAEAAALAIKGVTQAQGASAGYSHRRMHLAASNGFSAGYTRTDHSLSCVAISGEGLKMEREYDGDHRIFREDMRSAEDIGTRAGERAVARAGAKKPPTGAFPVVYDERISSSLIGHLMSAMSGSAITRGTSWLRESMGTQVLPEALSVIENPHRPRATGTRPFDAEGLPTQTRAFVQDGKLTSWILDLATARKLGLASTGNAQRGTSAPPSPGLTNLALTQGVQSKDQILAEMGTGLLVTGMIGSSINPNTGDYSRGASGFWVENGDIAYPVNECTLAGNLRDMLMNIAPANDARLHLSRVVPSLRVEGLTLAGA